MDACVAVYIRTRRYRTPLLEYIVCAVEDRACAADNLDRLVNYGDSGSGIGCFLVERHGRGRESRAHVVVDNRPGPYRP